MSSIYAQIGKGPFIFKYAEKMGMRPFLVTASLCCLLDRDVEDRPANFAEMVEKSFKEFTSERSKLGHLIFGNAWKHRNWDRTSKIFYNMKCELCTLDESVADYVRSLPPAFRGLLDLPTLSEDELREANVAYHQLIARVNAITG